MIAKTSTTPLDHDVYIVGERIDRVFTHARVEKIPEVKLGWQRCVLVDVGRKEGHFFSNVLDIEKGIIRREGTHQYVLETLGPERSVRYRKLLLMRDVTEARISKLLKPKGRLNLRPIGHW